MGDPVDLDALNRIADLVLKYKPKKKKPKAKGIRSAKKRLKRTKKRAKGKTAS